MDTIFALKSEELEDYYSLLGCDELSSSEQILSEFKVRALECHPDKHPENPKAVEDFQKLLEAKEILTNESSRKSYDLWRRSNITIPFGDWQALSDSVRTSMHWAVKTKKEPMLEGSKDPFIVSPMERSEQRPSVETQSPHTPTSPSENSGYLRFRWTNDAPSALLRKFRNYEI